MIIIIDILDNMRPIRSVLIGNSITSLIMVSFLLTELVSLSYQTSPYLGQNFTVSVYQMQVKPTLSSKMTRKQALAAMSIRIAEFEAQAEEAARRNSQILVFPEYGLYADYTDLSRLTMSVFLEPIPKPMANYPWNPCDLEPEEDVTILRNLSCMAKKNKLFIVANVGERDICSHSNDEFCPFDGQYQFNTNVVFDSEGNLVSKYRKFYLFQEFHFDSARKIEHMVIDTPFGKFVNIIGFDLMYTNTLKNIVEDGVRNIFYSNTWPNLLPLYLSVSYHAAIAWAANVNLISANMEIPLVDKMTGGSGFYKGGSGFEYSFCAPCLMTTNMTEIKPDAPTNFIKPSKRKIPNADGSFSDIYEVNDTETKSVKLSPSDSIINVCHKQFCCVADYKFSYQPVGIAGYFLAINSFEATGKSMDMKLCVLATMTLDNSTCPVLPVDDSVTFASFKRLKIFATGFDTKYIFPQVILLRNNSYEVLDPSSYYRKGKMKLRNTLPLYSASLIGRTDWPH